MKLFNRLFTLLLTVSITICSLSGCGGSKNEITAIIEPVDQAVRSALTTDATVPILTIHSFPVFEFYDGVQTINDLLDKAIAYENESISNNETTVVQHKYVLWKDSDWPEIYQRDTQTESFHESISCEFVFLKCFFEEPNLPFTASHSENIPKKVVINRVTLSEYLGTWVLYETNYGDFIYYTHGAILFGGNDEYLTTYTSYLFPLAEFLHLAPDIERIYKTKSEEDSISMSISMPSIFSELSVSEWSVNFS